MFTNKPACGPKRGHGTPQPRFGQEVQLDKIADEARHRPGRAAAAERCAKANSLTASWLRIGSTGLDECIDKVVEMSGWKERRAQAARCGRGARARVQHLHVRRGRADLLEQDAALGRADPARPLGQRHRRSAARPRSGQGSRRRARGVRRRSARRRYRRRARRHRRHRHHAGRPRLLLEPRHHHGGQRRDPGGRAPARD